jgi:hypothetical protein
MTYTVVWKATAEQQLARTWTDAADRNAVNAAAREIDGLLRSDPWTQGESRTRTIRVAFIHPLGVYFHVSEADRLVSVLRVWLIG